MQHVGKRCSVQQVAHGLGRKSGNLRALSASVPKVVEGDCEAARRLELTLRLIRSSWPH